MADITALGGPGVATTVNGVTVRLTEGRLRIGSKILKFGTTGQTLDADLKAWMNSLPGGMNDWSFEMNGYTDHNATAAARLLGNNIKFRPGTVPPGVFMVLLTVGDGFQGNYNVENFEVDWNAEDGEKPVRCRVSGVGDGPLTYINV